MNTDHISPEDWAAARAQATALLAGQAPGATGQDAADRAVAAVLAEHGRANASNNFGWGPIMEAASAHRVVAREQLRHRLAPPVEAPR